MTVYRESLVYKRSVPDLSPWFLFSISYLCASISASVEKFAESVFSCIFAVSSVRIAAASPRPSKASAGSTPAAKARCIVLVTIALRLAEDLASTHKPLFWSYKSDFPPILKACLILSYSSGTPKLVARAKA